MASTIQFAVLKSRFEQIHEDALLAGSCSPYRWRSDLEYVAVMPARSRTTPRSEAEELGILFCLMTVASPLARQYYFMWLFFR